MAEISSREASEEEGLTELDKRTLLYGEHFRHSQGESDRGLVLFTASQMDVYLREILEAFIIENASRKDVKDLFEGPFAPLGNLSGRNKIAFMLGLISKHEYEVVDAVRAVRNKFAHHIDASFEHPKIREICSKPPIYDGRLCDRDAFLHMGMNGALPLLYRCVRVRREWRRLELSDAEAQKR